MWVDYAKTLLVLVGICLIALVAVKMLVPRLKGLAMPASSSINVFARYPLEPRKTLYLVKAGKDVVLLATAGETVQFMTTLDPDGFEEIATPAAIAVESGSTFRRIMQVFADRSPSRSL
jgi:flagellar biogenesis protein FliO